jgi:hypothetical protein
MRYVQVEVTLLVPDVSPASRPGSPANRAKTAGGTTSQASNVGNARLVDGAGALVDDAVGGPPPLALDPDDALSHPVATRARTAHATASR